MGAVYALSMPLQTEIGPSGRPGILFREVLMP
jgi:hypothetical protein